MLVAELCALVEEREGERESEDVGCVCGSGEREFVSA